MSRGCKGCPYLCRMSFEDITCSRYEKMLRDPAIYTNEDKAFIALWNLCKCDLGRKVKKEVSDERDT